MAAIDVVKAHYARQEIRKLPVPEWEMDIYCKPMNMVQQVKINELAEGDQGMYYAMAVVVCSLDEEGNKLFGLGDALAMANQADAAVVSRIGTWLFAGGSATPEDHAKNS